jgi:hypothetical protein
MNLWAMLSRKYVASMPGDSLKKILQRRLRRSEGSGTLTLTFDIAGKLLDGSMIYGECKWWKDPVGENILGPTDRAGIPHQLWP